MPRAPPTGYTTQVLSAARWADFERLFERYGGVQDGCWCMFYHRDRPNRVRATSTRHAKNREDHRRWVRDGRAHGVLVYYGGRAVGWCQYGRSAELPRIERGRIYRSLPEVRDPAPDWRITCFFVDRPHRRSHVASLALAAALRAIASSGGGVVEGYPATHFRAVGTWFGTVSMFAREGFRTLAPLGRSHVVVRRRVRAG